MPPEADPSPFALPPATRTALIIGGFFLLLITLGSYWVSKEAMRIKHQREATSVVSNTLTGEMIWIPAGGFTMGGVGDQTLPDEIPLHDVKIDGFWIDQAEVTNEEFARFVAATKYITQAERPLSVRTVPGLPTAIEGRPASRCFAPPAPGQPLEAGYTPWSWVIGADWQHPSGPGSDLQGLEKHPVVHVAYEDATSYAAWAGKRLPSESEWEYAARGGLMTKPFVWGSEKTPGGRWMANLWQGRFPSDHQVLDGFPGIAPVRSFPPNNFDLYDMAGNVAEWTADWYRADTYALLAKIPERGARRNPTGPADSLDPEDPGTAKRVIRGGSYLSSDNNGHAYHPSTRGKQPPTWPQQDLGFRCVKSAPK